MAGSKTYPPVGLRVIVYIPEGEEEADGPEEGGALPDPEEAFLEVGDLGEGASAQADDAVGEDPVGQKASSQGRETEARGVQIREPEENGGA